MRVRIRGLTHAVLSAGLEMTSFTRCMIPFVRSREGHQDIGTMLLVCDDADDEVTCMTCLVG